MRVEGEEDAEGEVDGKVVLGGREEEGNGRENSQDIGRAVVESTHIRISEKRRGKEVLQCALPEESH